MNVTNLDEALEQFALNRESDYAATLASKLEAISFAITQLGTDLALEFGPDYESISFALVPLPAEDRLPGMPDRSLAWMMSPRCSTRVAADLGALLLLVAETTKEPDPRSAARMINARVRLLFSACPVLGSSGDTRIDPAALLFAQKQVNALRDWLSFASQVSRIALDTRIEKVIVPKAEANGITIVLTGGKGPGAPRDIATRHLLGALRRLQGNRTMSEMIREAAMKLVALGYDEKPAAKIGATSAKTPKAKKSASARVRLEVKRLEAFYKSPVWGGDVEKAKATFRKDMASRPNKSPLPSAD